MGSRGAMLYENWSAALLHACNTPEFWRTYREKINTFPEPPNLDDSLSPLVPRGSQFGNLTEDVDRHYGVTEAYLFPYKDDILTYTSAVSLAEIQGTTGELETVRAHALDSLAFAALYSVGLASDTFMQHYDPNALSQSANTEAHLAKLHFIIRALGNRSFIYALESMRITGFATLGADCVFTIEAEGQPHDRGWLLRAHRNGLIPPIEDTVISPLYYDEPTNTFMVKPESEAYLREALRAQNVHGLNEEALDTAGPIAKFEPPLSRGCPVQAAIGRTCLFTANALWHTL